MSHASQMLISHSGRESIDGKVTVCTALGARPEVVLLDWGKCIVAPKGAAQPASHHHHNLHHPSLNAGEMYQGNNPNSTSEHSMAHC